MVFGRTILSFFIYEKKLSRNLSYFLYKKKLQVDCSQKGECNEKKIWNDSWRISRKQKIALRKSLHPAKKCKKYKIRSRLYLLSVTHKKKSPNLELFFDYRNFL